MKNRFKCTKCGKIFYLADRPDLTSREDRKSVMCTPCWKYLTEAKNYQEYLERR